jgi:hypothetical protein
MAHQGSWSIGTLQGDDDEWQPSSMSEVVARHRRVRTICFCFLGDTPMSRIFAGGKIGASGWIRICGPSFAQRNGGPLIPRRQPGEADLPQASWLLGLDSNQQPSG